MTAVAKEGLTPAVVARKRMEREVRGREEVMQEAEREVVTTAVVTTAVLASVVEGLASRRPGGGWRLQGRLSRAHLTPRWALPAVAAVQLKRWARSLR